MANAWCMTLAGALVMLTLPLGTADPRELPAPETAALGREAPDCATLALTGACLRIENGWAVHGDLPPLCAVTVYGAWYETYPCPPAPMGCHLGVVAVTVTGAGYATGMATCTLGSVSATAVAAPHGSDWGAGALAGTGPSCYLSTFGAVYAHAQCVIA